VPVGPIILWEAAGLLVFLAAFLAAFGVNGKLKVSGAEERLGWGQREWEERRSKEGYLKMLWRIVVGVM